jgi:dienelactone hydrolase
MVATATEVRPGPAPAPPRTRRGGGRRETLVFRVAIALIALHVLDDTVLQPPAGTAPRLISALVPLVLLGLAGWAYPRLPGAARGGLSLALGVLGVAAGAEAFHYTREVGPSGDDFTGLAAIPAALVLVGLGAVTLWRTRRVQGNRAWRYGRRGLLAVAGAVTLATVLFPIGLGYVTTHVGRAVVPPDHLGVPHEDVSFGTADGLELQGWYVPSRNGAAVIVFPGRSGPQKQTRMLARHGYGVLLFDRRGEGESEGAPNAWGWGGGKDIEAAIRYLQRRPDVQPGRIGGIGLSVGGEMMIETAAHTDALAAVVSEGAGARSIREDVDMDAPTTDKVLGLPLAVVKTAAIAVFAGQSPPEDLEALAARVDRPMLLIAAPNSRHGEELNRDYQRAAGDTSSLWEIPESGHVGGLSARPAEYERRVVGFLDAALLR